MEGSKNVGYAYNDAYYLALKSNNMQIDAKRQTVKMLCTMNAVTKE